MSKLQIIIDAETGEEARRLIHSLLADGLAEMAPGSAVPPLPMNPPPGVAAAPAPEPVAEKPSRKPRATKAPEPTPEPAPEPEPVAVAEDPVAEPVAEAAPAEPAPAVLDDKQITILTEGVRAALKSALDRGVKPEAIRKGFQSRYGETVTSAGRVPVEKMGDAATWLEGLRP